MIRRTFLFALLFWLGAASGVQAQEWGQIANISTTMGVSDSRICIGEGSRGDIGCPSYAPTVSATGRLNVSSGLTADTVSLTTAGTTWGYLGSTASYLPNISSNAVSATNISATTINGIAVSSLGASATVISGTTTMVSGWPDALICSNTTASWGTRILYLTGAPAATGIYFYADTGYGVADLYVGFNADGSYSTANQGGAMSNTGGCYNKSISTLYSEGKAFNFIGNSGSGGSALGDRLTSGTLAVTANSATSVVSLTTGATTWGYMGSTASYLPNFSSNAISATNISATTINGVSVSALGGASPTNVPAFRVHLSANQSIATSTATKLNFNNELYDTYNNFNPSTYRFTPTVAGYYWVTLTVACPAVTSGQACQAIIQKNGSGFGAGIARSTNTLITATASALIYMNGSTDYLEGVGYSEATTAVINASDTHFSGALIASGNGLVSGTGATALSGLTDVTLSSPATGQVLTYNGTRWVNATPSATTVISGTTSMVEGWPDAIRCYGATGSTLLYRKYGNVANTNGVYSIGWSALSGGDADLLINFNTSQTIATVSDRGGSAWAGYYGTNCTVGATLSSFYAAGNAFNFIGNSGSGGTASGFAITSGTLAVTANSATSVVSLTTGATTWGYMGSTASYLPNFSSNAISTSSINLGGLNLTSSSLVSSTGQVAFSVHKNGTAQTVTTNTWTKLTWSTEAFDTNNNFASDRFTPTVAGYYLFTASVVCSDGSSFCYSGIYKNGTQIRSLFVRTPTTSSAATVNDILYMNGTTDYVEAFGRNNGGTSISGATTETWFSGALLNGGSGSGGGSGVSAIASLTDVTLTSPVSNSLLVYDGSKWVNRLFQDTVSTTTMKLGAPDALICSNSTSKFVLYYAAELSGGNFFYRLVQDPTSSNDYNMTFTPAGAYSSHTNMAGSDCLSKSFTQLYTEGKAFNFIGGNGSGSTASGFAITSGTLAVTANSATSVVSLTTGATTWGYLGANASYLPNLSTNALTVGGLTLTSSSLVSSSAQVAFSVHKNGTNQTVTANTSTKLTWSTKEYDTNNNFNTATGRFIPTVPGYYYANLTAHCLDSTAYCQVLIYKNTNIIMNDFTRSSSNNIANATGVVYLNGSTDYLEGFVFNSAGVSIDGGPALTRFQGFLIGGGSGSGGGSGVSAIASLTDVTLTSPVSNSLLVYNGTRWVNRLFQDTVSTTTMLAGVPDAIRCFGTDGDMLLHLENRNAAQGYVYYRSLQSPTGIYISFNATTGAQVTLANGGSTYLTSCTSKSLSQLYTDGNAFNFIGGSGSGSTASGFAITSGTLSVTANSATSVVSLTTGATTWGYMGSTASYLPNFSSNAISTSSINLGGLNVTSSSLVSSTGQVAFSVHKNGTNQTVTASTWTKVTWSTEVFDTNNNFASDRFTPTVAGKYYLTASVYCADATTICNVGIYKNGTLSIYSFGRGANTMGIASAVVDMNGTTDYVEVFANNGAGTSLSGAAINTFFSGFLINGSGGSSGSSGVSAIASLTDVTLTSPVSNSLLVYDGSKWVNRLFQDTVSTSTMISGWPDAIVCTDTGGTPGPTGRQNIFWQMYREASNNNMIYAWTTDTVMYNMIFTSSGAYSSKYVTGSQTDTFDCESQSISQLYAAGKAFNFLGSNSSGSTAMGDRLTSGTLAVTANSATSVVSLTTGATTWGYMGSTASYLPNLSTNALTVGGVAITSTSLTSTTAQVAFSVDKNGTAQTVTAGADTKLTWSRELIDTNNNFDTATGRFTPTVAGYYYFQVQVTCNNTASGYCAAFVYKNGSMINRGYSRDASGNSQVSQVLYMNGTTDYVEAYAVNLDATTIAGDVINTNFRGMLISGGSGSGGSGVSAMASLTDVTLTSPVSNSLLVYNGTRWVNRLFQDTVSTTTMEIGFPDAIVCTESAVGDRVFYLSSNSSSGASYRFLADPTGPDYYIIFTAAGAYSTTNNTTIAGNCVSKSITQLYASGQSFNFIGTSGSGNSDRILSGTTSVAATGTGLINFTTSGTTTGYFDTSGRLVAPGISLTTLNGISSTNGYFSGRVGIGVTTPTTALHISGSSMLLSGNNSIMIIQDRANISSSLNLAGWISFQDGNGSEYGWVGDGSTSTNKFFVMSRLAEGLALGTAGTERLTIDNSGNVGIGISTPGARLHSNGNIMASDNSNAASGSYSNSWNRVFMSPTGYIWSTMDSAQVSANLYLHRHNTSYPFISFGYSTSQIGSISTNGSSVAYNTTSDYRLKEDVRLMDHSLDRIGLLKPSTFRFRKDPSHTLVDGFIAHEVQKVVPSAVTGKKDELDKDGKPVYQQVDYSKLVPLLTAGVQELHSLVRSVLVELSGLKQENTALKEDLKLLQEQMMHLQNDMQELKRAR